MNNTSDKFKVFIEKFKQFITAKGEDRNFMMPDGAVFLVLSLWIPMLCLGFTFIKEWWYFIFFISSSISVPLGFYLMKYLSVDKKWNRILSGVLGYLLFVISIFALPVIFIIAIIIIIMIIDHKSNKDKKQDYEEDDLTYTYICRCCGKESRVDFDEDFECSLSPDRLHHTMIKRSPLMCQFCGQKNVYPNSSRCRVGARTNQSHILLDGNPVKCKYCGKDWIWSDWACNQSPHGYHELTD